MSCLHPFPSIGNLRVLFLTIEYLDPIFSGNGTLSRSLVRSLRSQGATVCVVTGRKDDCDSGMRVDIEDDDSTYPTKVVSVPIPTTKWNRLDVSCGWEEYAAGVVRDDECGNVIRDFAANVVIAVDWHAMHIINQIKNLDTCTTGSTVSPLLRYLASIPVVYMNFRVYTMSKGLVSDPSHRHFYETMEQNAIRNASRTVCLCRSDAINMFQIANGYNADSGHYFGEEGAEFMVAPAFIPDIRVLLPPLRADVAVVAQAAAAESKLHDDAALLVSMVRLSPEKNAHLFAEACTNNVLIDAMIELRMKPYLCGSASDAAYAASVRDRIRSVSTLSCNRVMSEIETRFMGPLELQNVLSRAAANMHPSFTEAYGMTIVEAAAFGIPSIVHTTTNTTISTILAREKAHPPPLMFERVSADQQGYLRLCCPQAASWKTAQDCVNASLQVCFPPIGACDLLGDPIVTPCHSVSEPGTTTDCAGTEDATHGAVLGVDWGCKEVSVLAENISAILRDRKRLQQVGARAREIALSWLEPQAAVALMDVLCDRFRDEKDVMAETSP